MSRLEFLGLGCGYYCAFLKNMVKYFPLSLPSSPSLPAFWLATVKRMCPYSHTISWLRFWPAHSSVTRQSDWVLTCGVEAEKNSCHHSHPIALATWWQLEVAANPRYPSWPGAGPCYTSAYSLIVAPASFSFLNISPLVLPCPRRRFSPIFSSWQ